MFYRSISAFIAVAFLTTTIVPRGLGLSVVEAYGQSVAPQTVLSLPVPGTMVGLSENFTPTMIKGMTIHPENPLQFNFIVDTGDTGMQQGRVLENEATKLVKYFLASLTVPENEMWVNLSPYEENRIIADGLGNTEMGRDMLAQDYLLKQLTSSLMYPEDELGAVFWERVYARAQEEFGTTDIPMNTFNKIWIVPEKAVVFEDEKTSSTYVLESHLKVMLEEDYVDVSNNVGAGLASARNNEGGGKPLPYNNSNNISTPIIRDILLPEIEREVNEGKTFANLRQIYNSMILATWYKQNLKESLLGKIYMDQNKTKGIDIEDKQITQKIYDQYIASFKKGVYDYIREEYDSNTQEIIPRKYFSGGILGAVMNKDFSMVVLKDRSDIDKSVFSDNPQFSAMFDFAELGADSAQMSIIKKGLNLVLRRDGKNGGSIMENDVKSVDKYDAEKTTYNERIWGFWRAIEASQEKHAEGFQGYKYNGLKDDYKRALKAKRLMKSLLNKIIKKANKGIIRQDLEMAELVMNHAYFLSFWWGIESTEEAVRVMKVWVNLEEAIAKAGVGKIITIDLIKKFINNQYRLIPTDRPEPPYFGAKNFERKYVHYIDTGETKEYGQPMETWSLKPELNKKTSYVVDGGQKGFERPYENFIEEYEYPFRRLEPLIDMIKNGMVKKNPEKINAFFGETIIEKSSVTEIDGNAQKLLSGQAEKEPDSSMMVDKVGKEKKALFKKAEGKLLEFKEALDEVKGENSWDEWEVVSVSSSNPSYVGLVRKKKIEEGFHEGLIIYQGKDSFFVKSGIVKISQKQSMLVFIDPMIKEPKIWYEGKELTKDIVLKKGAEFFSLEHQAEQKEIKEIVRRLESGEILQALQKYEMLFSKKSFRRVKKFFQSDVKVYDLKHNAEDIGYFLVSFIEALRVNYGEGFVYPRYVTLNFGSIQLDEDFMRDFRKGVEKLLSSKSNQLAFVAEEGYFSVGIDSLNDEIIEDILNSFFLKILSRVKDLQKKNKFQLNENSGIDYFIAKNNLKNMIAGLYYNDSDEETLDRYVMTKDQYKKRRYEDQDMVIVSSDGVTEDLKKALLNLHKKNFEEAVGGFKIRGSNIDQILEKLRKFDLDFKTLTDDFGNIISFMEDLKKHNFAMMTEKKEDAARAVKEIEIEEGDESMMAGKVLVVDNDASDKKKLIEKLRSGGYEDILEAKDGNEALEILRKYGKDIGKVISDWEMPGMDGIALAQEMQKEEAFSEIPFILISNSIIVESAFIKKSKFIIDEGIDGNIVNAFFDEMEKKGYVYIDRGNVLDTGKFNGLTDQFKEDFSEYENLLPKFSEILSDNIAEEKEKLKNQFTRLDIEFPDEKIDRIFNKNLLRLSDHGFFENDDKSMASNEKPLGGINLDPAMLDLQIKRDGNGVPLPVSEQDFSMMRIEGVLPIIINVTPVSIPGLLGFVDTEAPVTGCPSDSESMDCDRALISIKPEEEVVL